MIVCTRSAVALCQRSFGKDDVAVASVDSIISSLGLDPTLSKPSREVYIVTSEDFRSVKTRDEFLTSASNKFESIAIVYIARKGKDTIEEGKGINKVLVKPDVKTLTEVVSQLVGNIMKKTFIVSSQDRITKMGKYTPEEFQQPVEVVQEETVNELPPIVEKGEFTVPIPEEPIVQEPPKQTGDTMATRIQRCNTVSDVRMLTAECSAAVIMKELAKDNSEYRIVEDKLTGLREKIYAIMADMSGDTLEVKLDKVRASLYDKNYYKDKNNTILEQRVEEIIEAITTTTKNLLSVRLKELDDALMLTSAKANESTYARLAGIAEERANLILELATMDKELKDIYYGVDKFAHSTAAYLAEEDADLTGSPLLNSQLRAKAKDTIISGNSLDHIIKVISTCDKTSKEFEEATLQLHTMQEKLNRMLNLDREQITAQEEVIRYLNANSIEDTVVAKTMLKRSLRVFMGVEGSGKTVVPLVLSKLKSRQNTNVLLVDLTGSAKFTDYNEEVMGIKEWLADRTEKECCVVAGEIKDTPEAVQKLVVALTKAADYYRVINVVLTPEQQELFRAIAIDVLTINYIVNPELREIDYMRDVIQATNVDNVGKRVIVNKAAIRVKPIIDRLGIMDALNVQVISIPYVPQIVETGLNTIKPYEVSAIVENFAEVTKYA